MSAEKADPASPSCDLQQWIADHLSSDYSNVLRLLEEAKVDPPEEPYRSLYAARELISGVCTIMVDVDTCRFSIPYSW